MVLNKSFASSQFKGDGSFSFGKSECEVTSSARTFPG